MQQLVEQAKSGSIRAASRLISLLENDPARLPDLFAGMADWPEPRLVVGITGAPGVGKSTLVDGMITEWRRRQPDKRLGVVAVDPSSPFTGGAVLGDRIRMMNHATDPMVFIRSLASRGHLGGLTLGVKGSLRVMGLAGCDVVLIETVGVGQSEVEVAGIADLVVIALAPGQGDSIQMLKAGLMESGDIFVVNKADRAGSERLFAELSATLSLGQIPKHMTVAPDLFRVSALERSGLPDLVAGIEDRAERVCDVIEARRSRSMHEEVHHAILESARKRLETAMGANGAASEKIDRVLSGGSTVIELADEILNLAAEQLRKEKQ